MRKPGISKVGFHALSERVHRGGVVFEGCACGRIQGERIGMLQKKGVDAYGVGHGLQGGFCMPLARSAPLAASGRHMPADILDKRGAAFEVPEQSLVRCEGASHAPGF